MTIRPLSFAPLRKLKFFLTLGFLYPLSLVPFWFWYKVSDLIFLVIFKAIGYRKKVVWANISGSFPEKSERELEEIMEKFYRHLCDLLVESLKSISMRDQAVIRRVQIENKEVWEEFLRSEKPAILLAGHYGNFELWGARMDILAAGKRKGYCIYTPPKSETLNGLIHHIRIRRGGNLLPRKHYVRKIREIVAKQEFVVVLGDQSPHKSQRAYFTEFLGRPTAFFTSTSRYSLELGMEVYFVRASKKARGYYSLGLERLPREDFLPLREDMAYAFTDLQAERFEAMIRQEPAFWLWSHKRWKRGPGGRDKLSPKLTKQA